MMKRVLITGGHGYLGGRIAVALARQSWVIRLGSRKGQAAPAWLPQAETVAMDLLDSTSLESALTDVQMVVHLAAMNENECVVHPEKAVSVNTLGALALLRAAMQADIERFLYFSTAHVYGAPLAGCIDERTLPRPIHPYAITHRAAEDFVLAAHDERRITGLVVRLSNGFGAPTHPDVDRWTLLVNDLCRQVVRTRKMVLRSSGLQQRDFITLEDVGRSVDHLLGLPRELIGDGLFNLGGEAAMSIWEMTQRIAQRCQATLGFNPEIIRPLPAPGEQAPTLNYRCDKLKKTGFQLSGDFERELDNTLELCAQVWSHEVVER